MSSPVAAPVNKQEPKMFGFLGDDVINRFVRKVVMAAELNEATQVTYNLQLFRDTRLAIDAFILEHIKDSDLDKLYELKVNNDQEKLDKFFETKIPQFEKKLTGLLDQLYQQERITLQF